MPRLMLLFYLGLLFYPRTWESLKFPSEENGHAQSRSSAQPGSGSAKPWQWCEPGQGVFQGSAVPRCALGLPSAPFDPEYSQHQAAKGLQLPSVFVQLFPHLISPWELRQGRRRMGSGGKDTHACPCPALRGSGFH